MKFIKHLLRLVILTWGYLTKRNRDSKVIYYHDLDNKYTDMGTCFDLFKKHIEVINKAKFSIVPSITKEKNEVMICFDDGWAGIYDYKDYFIENRIFPTVFIAVDLIGRKGYLSKSQIQELQALGFLFECHSWSHEDLTTFTDDQLIHELVDSKMELEKMFNKSFNSICYPKGRFSKKVFINCERAGYNYQYSSICGGYDDMKELGVICRNCAQFSTPLEFKLMLNSTSLFFRHRFIDQHYSKQQL